MYKRILIATDGSKLSEKAVESGLSLAALGEAEAPAGCPLPHSRGRPCRIGSL